MTVYLDEPRLEQIIGRDHLLAAAPGAAPDTIDSDRVARAIDAVGTRIDAALRAYYDLPLADVPGFLASAAARLVHAELCNEASTTELIRQRGEAAERLLRDIAAGRLRVGGDLDGLPATANMGTAQGSAIVVRPAVRRFSRDQTAGIV